MSKVALRRTFKALRSQLSEADRGRAGEMLVQQVDSVLAALRARFIALQAPFSAAFFHPLGDEIDVRLAIGALQQRGFDIALPRVAGRDRPLVFHRFSRFEDLAAGAFGVMEPQKHAPVVTPDVVFAPLLAFDDAGGRLGYGGGFYDRTLGALRAEGARVPFIGVGFHAQKSDARLPMEAFDIPLDGVWTERGLTLFEGAI